jgi:DNA polymerase-1
MPTFYLIDGMGQFFRAYHAIRTPMTSPVTKEPTNLTFGFVGMLLKLLRAEGANVRAAGGPDYLAVAMDVGGDRGTFRSQIYPEYKANRSEPPTDLLPQVARCVAMLEAMGVPVIGVEGFEADDVMATIVTRVRASRPDVTIRLVSKDKDLKQLLSGGGAGAGEGARGVVELFDIHTDTPYSAASLKADTGLEPSHVADMLTLMGDTVDNVPGIDGVGEKTAAQMLRDFGSFDALVARAAEIKGKRGEKVREAIPRLGLTRELVTLRHDVPCEFDLDAARVDAVRLDALLPILRELGFNRAQEEVRALIAQRAGGGAGARAADHAAAPVARAAAPSLFAPASGEGRGPGARGAGAGGGGALSSSASSTNAASSVRPRREANAEGARDDAGFPGLFDAISAAVPEGGTGEARDAIPASRRAVAGAYECVTTLVRLREVVDEIRVAAARAKRAITAAPESPEADFALAIDTETTSLRFLDARLCGVSLAIVPGRAWYVPVRSPTPEAHLDERTVLDVLGPIIEDASLPKCGHNLKYDILVLRRAGVRLRGLGASGACDSMVASYLIDASRSGHGLDALALALLGRENIPISHLIGSGKEQRTFDTVPIDAATEYAAEDADVALQLRAIMLPQIRAMGMAPLFGDVELPLVDALAELEWNGIIVDPAELDRQRHRLVVRIEELTERLRSYWRSTLARDVDPDSPKQLAVALFAKPGDEVPGLGLPPGKKTKTGYSTDAEVLESLALEGQSPAPELILDYRQLTKLVSTYLVALKDAIHPDTGRVHTSFHQTVAATGRLASSDPNLQNIPIRTDVGREIRRAFIAAPGHVLVSADYSQIELRLLAHLSRDPALIDAFLKGRDIHAAVAAQIHKVRPEDVTREQRAGAKMVNFGIVYGITAFGLARRLKVPEREAAQIIDSYKRTFAGITTFLQECVEQARARGYVETILGRRRPIPDVDSSVPSRRALAERLAINSVVQGSAADLIKKAMVDLHADIQRANGRAAVRDPNGEGGASGASGGGDGGAGGDALPALRGTRMLLQIHDELVFESPADQAAAVIAHVRTRMEHAMELAVPLVADAGFGVNWFEED